MAAIDVKANLIIEQIRLDAQAKKELDDMKRAKGITPGSGSASEKEFDAAAKRQGLDRGARAQPGPLDKLQMANPATIAMKVLTSAIDTGIKNYKIAQTFQKKVVEALGLLVDLILLPFLPILIWALINLFKVVLWLGDVWKKTVETWFPKGIKPEIAKTAEDVAGKGAIALGPGPMIIAAAIVPKIIDAFKKIDWGKMWTDSALYKTIVLLSPTLKEVSKWFGSVGESIIGWWEGVKKIPEQLDKAWADMLLGLDEFHKMVDKIPQWFKDLGGNISKWFDEQWAILTVELDEIGKAWDVFYSILTSGFKSFVNIFIGLLNMVLNAMRKIPGLNLLVPEGTIPLLAEGGNVSKTGIAVVHAGETVIPAGKGGNTFNFYGYQDDAFIRKVRDVMRSDATRYSQ